MTKSARNVCHTRILVFAKAPIPGMVKTRLIPTLGAQRAAELQTALIYHTLATTAQSGLKVELWCYPDGKHPLFLTCARKFAIVLRTQKGADLGARMYHAVKMALAAGPAILIGTDCPTLTAEELRETSMRLERGSDAVLGPALDGGYYLLGLNRIHPSLFEDISWGSNRVLAETRRRLRILDWQWRETPARRDVDRPGDLACLPSALAGVIDGFFGNHP
uniref:Glycosyltransferase n=1 Tax=Candidatus Kentrum sp. TUN TaxID=2126343 RepID=A0A450ZM80_9GAMM|nr:MAG: hypothetical protein BECKTUN1418F_GA0071002_10602 [Candidatus Kentron sp. TUN]VFK58786.1 MAG: hypothetical protein BECKTUN1418D_GA0071000_10901 [Candidatus Kentron sp. TUN]VFK60647.1 MAG: hypothetical protein BECKTUN1418E_GA0071001_10592 [Candidatus Kentron sp. TUN]